MSTHSRATQRGAMDDLVAQIDCYLAEQLENDYYTPRPTSAGTMFLDLDQHGETQISYRNRCEMSRCPPPLVTQGMHVRYDRSAAGMYVEGYDHESRFRYDYNGDILHLHRDSSRASSAHSDYYRLDAEQYSPLRPFSLQGHRSTPSLHSKEKRKRHRAVDFIQAVLRKIEGMGLMRRFREDRVKVRQMAKTRNRRTKRCSVLSPVPQIPINWMEGLCT